MSQDGRKTREVLSIEAARWVVRLASDTCDEVTRQQFEAWRASSPACGLAFEREQLAWDRTERLKTLRTTMHYAGLAEPLRRASWMRRWLPRRGDSPHFWRLGAVAAGLVLTAGVAVFLWINITTDVYVTAVGERRSIQLADGSSLELNTDTKVAVRFTNTTRRLELIRGESLFDVRHDTTRPFLVVMGDNSVRAVGTAFNIRREADSFSVLVMEGVVEAQGSGTNRAPAYRVRLPAGSTGVYAADGMQSHRVSLAEQERVLSWRTGTIALAGETLAEAASEFNRYNTRRLVVSDPAIAGLQLGGYFDANDLEGFVNVLSAAFGVTAEHQGDQVFLTAVAPPVPLKEASRAAGK